MCDLGLVLGLAAGAAQTAGQASAAGKNRALIKQQHALEQTANQREFLVETNAANKEAYRASLEQDRSRGIVAASGAGMRGPTAGLRIAEQSRQGALSIASARDRTDAAKANYAFSGQNSKINAQNRIATQATVNPLTAFTNIATAGISNYGAFA